MTSSMDALTGLVKHRLTMLDKNYMIVVVGEPGSGKSADALSLANKIDPTFEKERRIVFTPEEFLRTIKKLKDAREKTLNKAKRIKISEPKLRPHQNRRRYTKEVVRVKPTICIVFDEAGVGIPAKEWQRIQNKLIGYVAQLFRHLNLCIIFTVPSMSFIDSTVKKLMHAIIETKSIDREHKIGVTKYWKIKHNAVFDTTTLEPLIISNERGHHRIDPLYIPFPPYELWKKYIGMKEAFAGKFYDDALQEVEGKKKSVDGNRIRALEKNSEGFMRSLPRLKEGRTWKDLAKETNISERSLRDKYKTAIEMYGDMATAAEV